MTHDRLMRWSERWFELLLRLYPAEFREEMGVDVVEGYLHRARSALARSGVRGLVALWLSGLAHSVSNGLGERLRPAASWRRTGDWGRDFGIARRRLLRSPVFVAATLGTLTVGLGAAAVVYTAVDKVLIERMAYRDPDNLYFVWRDQSASGGLKRDWLSGPQVADLQNAPGVIEAAVGMQLSAPTLSLSPDGEPQQIEMMLTSPNLFEVLGVAPVLGRGFAGNETGPKRPAVLVMSHALWKHLGGDPAMVGSQVWLSGSPYLVIGVMGPNFRFVRHGNIGPPREPDLYLPFAFDLATQNEAADYATFAALIRVRAGASPEQAAAAVDSVARGINERRRPANPVKFSAIRLKDDLVAPVRPILLSLGLAAVFLILVLTVNLSSLLLARAAEREHEFAVLRALGSDGLAVVRVMALEGAVLGAAGGALGALAGTWGARMLVLLAPLDLPRRSEIVLDGSVAAVVILVGLVLGLVAAALPAAWASRASLAPLLAKSSVRGAAGSQRWRRAIVVAQVALTLVLLSAGGLVARSFERLLSTDPGFKTEGVLTFAVSMGPRLFPDASGAFAFQDRVEAALSALPGVKSVGSTAALPLTASAPQNSVWGWRERISIPGAPGNSGDPQRDSMQVQIIANRAGYMESMGMRILAGRGFERRRPDHVLEALIDEHLARQFFPTGTPIGAAIPFRGKSLRIVGVVKQARLYNLHQDGQPQLIIRAEDWVRYMPIWVVKTSGDPRALIPEVRRAIRQIDSRIPVSSVQTMEEIVHDALRQQRISAVLIAGFALGALLLVAMGLFGMISGSVVRRHGELAVRLALGASHGRMLASILGEGAVLVASGMLIATPGVYAAGGLIRGLLVDLSPWDPLTLSAVTFGLLFVAMAACYLPARRVLRIDPAPLLRHS